ncbi:MAG: response regulator, partial [Acidobacteriota bacterium]
MHASSLPAEPEGPALGPSPMVLIVEDETSLAMAERRTLERAGYRVQTAIDVPQARRALDSDDIGLVLLDYMLPGDKGSDLVTELGERLETLPVIMVTGYADVDLAVGMLKAGVADYLVKDSSLRFLRELPETVAATL